jgi:hypothetical protein
MLGACSGGPKDEGDNVTLVAPTRALFESALHKQQPVLTTLHPIIPTREQQSWKRKQPLLHPLATADRNAEYPPKGVAPNSAKVSEVKEGGWKVTIRLRYKNTRWDGMRVFSAPEPRVLAHRR